MSLPAIAIANGAILLANAVMLAVNFSTARQLHLQLNRVQETNRTQTETAKIQSDIAKALPRPPQRLRIGLCETCSDRLKAVVEEHGNPESVSLFISEPRA